MTQWKGQCNKDKHRSDFGNDLFCYHCWLSCSQDAPCICCLEARIAKAIGLHQMVIDFDSCGEEVEHCEECGHISGEPPDDECPTVRALKGNR